MKQIRPPNNVSEAQNGCDIQDFVESSQRGDRQAFEALYRIHASRIYSLAFRFAGGDAEQAADWTQDIFVRAWQRLDQFQGRSQFSTWLYRLACNTCISELRRRQHELHQSVELVESMYPDPVSIPPRVCAIDLEAAVVRLPERARTALALHDIEGYRHAEIANLLDIAIGTSKAHLHRARKLLRQLLA